DFWFFLPILPFDRCRDLPPFPTRRSSDLWPPSSRPAKSAPVGAHVRPSSIERWIRVRRTLPSPSLTMTWRYMVSPSVNTSLGSRSEEHTSELQSRFVFVCRLLLENKKCRK